MTTLKDLSQQLGLSVTQVSRALNGHADVSESTRERVKALAAELHYQPNVSARRLVSGKSGIVGLVLPHLPLPPEDGQFIRIVGGLSAHFSRLRMQFVLHIAEESEDILDVYRRLIQSGAIDGFVIIEPQVNDPRVAFLRDRDVPFVLHGRDCATPDYPFFDIDNHAVARTLTRVLTRAGHRRIAFINGLDGRAYVAAREAGFRAAAAAEGLQSDALMHFTGEMVESHGLLATVEAFRDSACAPTALIAGNTRIAKGIFLALAALGLRVPQDVSLVAHDDILHDALSHVFDPPLTVTQSALDLSWEPLAHCLAGAVEGRSLSSLQRIGACRLIQRASVAPPPEAA
ncbi:LacI family DNA-binding transcriptional regulator [Limimaricola sp.]|uniref:LacI family DNA-binding transcriptional regulator n=1 Tax=Limimaricola sp. TaxID=2211665 RepID=UPI0025C2D38F|nr:LacI family DNA-binding transcriptional regulator [Limimaricola sp.]